MRITIPNPALVLLVGPSGAGKSTFARRHFRPTEIVSSDAARGMLSDDPADQDASAEAFQLLALIVNGRLRRRLTTVVDATNLRAANRKHYLRLAHRYGVPAVVVAFDLPLALYQDRNANRHGRTVDGFVVEDQAARMPKTLAAVEVEGYSAVFTVVESEVAQVKVARSREAAPKS